MHKPLRTLVSAAVIGIMVSSAAQAAGFSLYTESNGYSTGNFGAGVAAEVADASTGWYNPAGLAFLHEQQLVLGAVGIFPTSSLSGNSTFVAPPAPNYVQTFTNLNGADNGLVPSFHYALPLGENTTFGLSVVAPYGLSTNWDPTSPVRYQATYTELITSTISPEIGSKLSENFSIGVGLDLQYSRVKFNRIVGLPTIYSILPPFNPMAVDSLSYNKGNSFGVGFHAGALAAFNDSHTRVGINYMSKMRHVFHGYSQLTGVLANNGFNIFDANLPIAGTFTSNNLTSNPIEFPDEITLSAYQDLNEKLAILGSAVYTGWSSLKTIQLNNVAAPSISNIGVTSLVNINASSHLNYSNVWRFALGANYKFNQKFMLRVGGGYDDTPTNDVDRDIRIPDASRWALSIGAHYNMLSNLGLDVGYTHLFPAKEPNINRTDALTSTSSYNVRASGEAHAELLGAQLTWTMDSVKKASTK